MTFDEQFEKQEALEKSMWIDEKAESPKGKEIALKKEIKTTETEIYEYLKSDHKPKIPYFGQKTEVQKKVTFAYNLSQNEGRTTGQIYPKNQ